MELSVNCIRYIITGTALINYYDFENPVQSGSIIRISGPILVSYAQKMQLSTDCAKIYFYRYLTNQLFGLRISSTVLIYNSDTGYQVKF